MSRIAVIGGGIFGSEAAIQLAAAGNEVTLFESNFDLLEGATSKSVLRLHLGFHYPRDYETALQSKVGYRDFLHRFPSCVDLDFPNYYAVAKNGSKRSTLEFATFAERTNLNMQRVDKSELDQAGFNSEGADSIWRNSEGAICIFKLREQLLYELKTQGVSCRFDTEIISAQFINNTWSLQESNSSHSGFDYVVRSTYGSDKISIEGPRELSREYEFHKTLVLEASAGIPKLGMTVIDGDYLTVLPKAFSESHLVYGPTPSVLARFEGKNYPDEWQEFRAEEIMQASEKIIIRFSEWFSGFHDFQVKDKLIATRAIERNVSGTDRRISQIEERAYNFFDICSGKIDHCIDLAQRLVKITQTKNGVRMTT